MGGHEVGEGGRAVEVGVTFGLLAAWAVHDLEEVAAMPGWARGHVPGLRQRYPRVPEQVWRRLESIDGREFAAAVGVMGGVVAIAAADGHRTGGRSGFYQAALNGFGLHALVHVAQAAAARGYTPGWSPRPWWSSPSRCGPGVGCGGPVFCVPRGRVMWQRAGR
jgi:hypothetical protein